MIRFFLGLVPAWAWAAFLALCAGSAVTYHFAALQRVRVEVLAEVEAQHAEQYRLRNTANAKVTDGFHARIKASQAAAARAAASADSLRNMLATVQHAATSGGDDGAAATAELFGSCIERYRGVAAEADRLAAQVSALQGFARVCVGR